MVESDLSPLWIGKRLNELGKVWLCLQPRSILAVMDKLGFQYPPEAFHGDVVKTVTHAAHRQTCTKLNHLLWIFMRAILASTVRIHDKSPRRSLADGGPKHRLTD